MGLTMDTHPHNPLPMTHNHSNAYMHTTNTTNKGCTQTLHTLNHKVTYSHATFIMNFRFNIIFCMWWRLSIEIMMFRITFIL